VVFVPAGKALFGALDRGVGHQRRYEKDELAAKLNEAGFEVETMSFQNQAGRLAWWINSKVMQRQGLPAAQSRLFDRFVPFFKALEGNDPKSGVSLIAVARKKAGDRAPKSAGTLVAAGSAS
jgi:hypothetical protein